MEEMRAILEDEGGLRVCIPQRNFKHEDGDPPAAREKYIGASAATVVLWSYNSLDSESHRMEYRMARNTELRRSLNHRVIHVFLQDLSDVIDSDVRALVRSGKYLQWNSDATNAQKKKFLDKLIAKVYGRLAY